MTLDAALTGNDAIATRGHELQHAVKVAAASAVVDRRSFEQFYRQVEDSCGVGAAGRFPARFDTATARDVGRRVLAGVRQQPVRTARSAVRARADPAHTSGAERHAIYAIER